MKHSVCRIEYGHAKRATEGMTCHAERPTNGKTGHAHMVSFQKQDKRARKRLFIERLYTERI